MNTFTRQKRILTGALGALLVAVPLAFSLNGCTDLDEQVYGSVTAENFYRTPEEILAAVAPIYAQMRTLTGSYQEISELSSDEAVIPVRGQDWLDGGKWLQAHQHTWDPTNDYFSSTWNDAFTGVARANSLLETLETADVPNKGPLTAEIRALRALFYYELMDWFGPVPIIGDEPGEFTVDPKNLPHRESRDKVFAFVESELLAVYPDLPDSWDAANTGRMTKGAADAILANMYLNAAVFTKNSDEINVQSYNSCKDAGTCQKAIDAVDRILDSGLYHLPDDWASSFAPNNAGSPDHILAVGFLAVDGLGENFPLKTLHYNQMTPSPWNGWAALAESYYSFDDADARTGIFLVGPQVSLDTGEPVTDRQGNPLVFTPEISDIQSATEGEGVRIMKLSFDPDHFESNFGNDYPLFRLGEMYLIKAEAMNELGQTGPAIQLINDMIRSKVYDPPAPLTGITSVEAARTAILEERLHELFYEGKRRQDLIRFGQFTRGWWEKEPGQTAYYGAATVPLATDSHVLLFPVPQSQIDANPNLMPQNPGY
ncbi:MAG TPA: RagB/SusD family nutrient uptake outer membrane protein [Rhodothermales bacterium]|nr:RagB/SusD family nutrient uptake outer membrane protein [Rhodothermales bacterium]